MRQKGQDFEQRAVALLREAGLRILACNFNTRGGEIDIIAREGETLVFVEVRARSNARFSGAAASVNWRKQRRLIHAAHLYLKQYAEAANPPCRFDVIAFEPPQSGAEREVRWIQGAFTA
jgi:putative endonuclease